MIGDSRFGVRVTAASKSLPISRDPLKTTPTHFRTPDL